MVGCISVDKLVEGRNTSLGQAATHNWQAVQCLAIFWADIEPAGVSGVSRCGACLSIMSAMPPSTFFFSCANAAVVVAIVVPTINERRAVFTVSVLSFSLSLLLFLFLSLSLSLTASVVVGVFTLFLRWRVKDSACCRHWSIQSPHTTHREASMVWSFELIQAALQLRAHNPHLLHLSSSILILNHAKRAKKLSSVPTGQMVLQ